MIAIIPGFPLDHRLREEIEDAHNSDLDPQSTNLAIVIVDSALANGYPTNPDAAEQALTGPPAAVAVQGAMEPYVEDAIGHDATAQAHSESAVQQGREGLVYGQRRQGLAQESVQLSDGSSLTRGQVCESHGKRHRVAAQREGRGDLEHLATPPGWPSRLAVAVPSSVIEALLLVWPVTNASWNDLKSVVCVAGLTVVFFFMNDQLPKWAGRSTRNARESRVAAEELTAIGLTVSQEGDPGRGRGILGEIDEPLVQTTKRSAIAWCAVIATVVAVYAMVMFTRVVGLAGGLHHGLMFSMLAAALITTFIAAGLVLMTWRWSRGNRLGDQLRETGAITAESRGMQDHLAQLAIGSSESSEDEAAMAAAEFAASDQVLQDGQRTAARGLQKAADILKQPKVLGPHPENMYQVHRPLQAEAQSNLAAASTLREQIRQALKSQPFPEHYVADPWATRTGRKAARPNPTFVPHSQLGNLYSPESRTRHRRSG